MKKVKRGMILLTSSTLPTLTVLMIMSLMIFATLSATSVSAVVINELLPNAAVEYDGEWLELYGNDAVTLNLSGWRITDGEANFTINDTNITISPNEFVLLVYNATHFNLTYNLSNMSNISNSTKIIEYGKVSPNLKLANSADNLELYNNFNELTDEFFWSTDPGENISFARCPDGGTNWTKTSQTPGNYNNCSQQNQEPSIELIYPSGVQCEENFSITTKAYDFDEGIYDVKIDILDSYDESHRVGKVWNGTKWLSTNSYVNSVLNVIGGNGTATLTYQVEDFEGEAILRPRIRKSGSSSYTQFDDGSIEVQCQSGQLPEESEIDIIDAPSRAKFGDEIEIELEVYKGDTKKYAVYVYVQNDDEEKVSDKVILHFHEKFTNYSEQVDLTLDCENESGTYEIVAEGLGVQNVREIELTECDENGTRTEQETGEGITIGDFTYSLTIPDTIYLNQEFQVKIKIINNGDEDKNFQVWSYVYRASKCYSCEDDNREANVETMKVKSNSFSEIVLKNRVSKESGAVPGDYKLKIKVLQEDLKTPKEFTYNISLIASEDDETQTTQQTQSAQSSPYSYSQYSSRVIESESFSMVKASSYVLSSLLLVLVIYLIIKKI